MSCFGYKTISRIILINCLFFFTSFDAISQTNVLGKPGYLMTPASRWEAGRRDLVLGLAYIPEKFAINNFMKAPFQELMIHGNIDIFDFLRLGVNLTYLPDIPQRIGIGDRHFDLSIRVWKEKKWLPSLMLILTPPIGVSDFLTHNVAVMTKTISWNTAERLEFSAGYGMDKVFFNTSAPTSQGRSYDFVSRSEMGNFYLNGFFSGMKYSPATWFGLILEYDSRQFHAAAHFLIWKKLALQTSWYGFEQWGGMIHYSLPLDTKPRELRRYEKRD